MRSKAIGSRRHLQGISVGQLARIATDTGQQDRRRTLHLWSGNLIEDAGAKHAALPAQGMRSGIVAQWDDQRGERLSGGLCGLNEGRLAHDDLVGIDIEGRENRRLIMVEEDGRRAQDNAMNRMARAINHLQAVSPRFIHLSENIAVDLYDL